MQFMIDFVKTDPYFLQILERTAEYPIVQGVVLDIDRRWLRFWAMKHNYPREDFFRYYGGPSWWIRPDWFGPNHLFAPLTHQDIDNLDWWKFWQEEFGLPSKSPFVVKVCLRPKATSDERVPSIGALSEAAGPLQVQIEARSRAQLSGNPQAPQSPLLGGVSIGVSATDYGTLGVLLTDNAKNRFGLTCAHVAGAGSIVLHPSQRDSRFSAAIGRVSQSMAPTSCAVGTACNPWSGAVPNEIDASLIEIYPSLSPTTLEVLDVGPLDSVAARASMSTSQPVQVTGRSCGFQNMQIGALSAWYSFHYNGSDYCFKSLFEVESLYGTVGIIKPGDSGAPICTAGANGMDWAGIIVGRDMFKGYAIFAETIHDWLVGQGKHLVLV